MRTISLANISSHTKSVWLALLVTILWSTSWVLIKIGLQDIPALPFAGLRYMLAFATLLPFVLRKRQIQTLLRLPPSAWLRLILLGLLMYTITQGSQFLSLFYLPAVTVSLLLSFTPVLVALLSIPLLGERPTGLQWAGTGLFLLGVGLYFYPVEIPKAEVIGLVVALVGVISNTLSAVLGRSVNRSGDLDPLTVTVVSMGIGSVILLGGGLAVQGMPVLNWQGWLIVFWLAVVNSAFAFTLWNMTLRTLSAVESSIINNTMLFQIAVLAWVFLDERLSGLDLLGMLLAAAGTLVVQLRRK